MTITVLEVRNYLIKPTMQQHFIDYFEEHFISSQREVGMHVLGQFRHIGDANHFLWIRGFEDMETRLKGLQSFYGGAFWAKHRSTTNSMILDNDDVLLLRPLSNIADLTSGVSAESIAADLADATILSSTGLIVLERYQAKAGQRETMIETVQAKVLPLYEREGIQVRGIFVAEMSDNTYPRLPVIQNADELVMITAYANQDEYFAQYDKLQTVIKDSTAGLLNRAPDTLLLSPTLRSPIRYQRV